MRLADGLTTTVGEVAAQEIDIYGPAIGDLVGVITGNPVIGYIFTSIQKEDELIAGLPGAGVVQVTLCDGCGIRYASVFPNGTLTLTLHL